MGCCSQGECLEGTAGLACGAGGNDCQNCELLAMSCVNHECQSVCEDGLCNESESPCSCEEDCGSPCAGKDCGDDGCGGACGECIDKQECVANVCVPVTPYWKDPETGLEWENWEAPPPWAESGLTWAEANQYCAQLTLDGGGWQLPTVDELRTLIRGCPGTETGGSCNVSTGDCLGWQCRNTACNGCNGPGPSNSLFWPPQLQGYQWYLHTCWSSTAVSDYQAEAWEVEFDWGRVQNLDKDQTISVRCVR